LFSENANLEGKKMDIYVGNLPYTTTEDDLTNMFSAFGKVDSAHIVKDKATGRSKGFGFVTMSNDQEAHNGINALNGTDIKGRAARINPAQDKPEGGNGGGGGGGRGNGGGGRGNGGGGDRQRRSY
jgi:RNA recognition motif-containing protein